MTPQIHEWCGQLDDPDGHGPCPCRAWATRVGAQADAAIEAAIVRARRTDDITARARKAAA